MRLTETVQRIGKEIELELQGVKLASNTVEAVLTTEMTRHVDKSAEEQIQFVKSHSADIIYNICKQTNPYSMWFVFHPDYAKGPNTISFCKDEKGNYIREQEYDVSKFDITSKEMQWFSDALIHGESWSKTYYWEAWDKTILSYSKALYIDSVLIGVGGSDFNFEDLNAKINQIKVHESGYLSVLDDSLNIIINPENIGLSVSECIGAELTAEFRKLIAGNPQGVFSFQKQEEKVVLAYSQLSNGWILTATLSANEIYAASREMAFVLIVIILISIFLSWLIAYQVGRSLTRPIHKLIEHFRTGGEGNFKVCSTIHSNDELGELAFHFNKFMGHTESLFDQLKNSEEKLIEARIKAEESERLKSNFLRHISHEVRTPLNAINGFSQLLTEDYRSSDQRQEYGQIIRDNVHYLAEILDDILEVSELELNRPQPNLKTFDLYQLLTDFHNEYQYKKTAISFDLFMPKEFERLMITTDPYRIRRILVHLIGNAFKFTEIGQIMYGFKVNGSFIEFYVKDTGIGISKEFKDSIYKPFSKGSSTMDKYRGAGIGLAVCKQFVEEMKGEIWCHSTEDEGTHFYFKIPVKHEELKNTYLEKVNLN